MLDEETRSSLFYLFQLQQMIRSCIHKIVEIFDHSTSSKCGWIANNRSPRGFPGISPRVFFMQDSFQKFFQFIPKIRTVFNWFNRLSFKHFSHSSRYFLLNFCRSFSRGLFQYFFRGFSYRFSKLLPDFRKYFLLEELPEVYSKISQFCRDSQSSSQDF